VIGKVHGRNSVLGGAKVSCSDEETITLFDGTFEFSSIRSGTGLVTASMKGYQSQTQKIEITEGSTACLNFQLQESIGTAKIFGNVYDYETKRPVSCRGTVILILPVANLYVHTESDGYFEFTRLPEDKYEILVSIAGYEMAKDVVSVGEGEQVKRDFLCRSVRTEQPPWG
jgi:hypothetical protein